MAESIRDGFRLESLVLKDAEGGEVYWESEWGGVERLFEDEQEARVPARILGAEAVAREMVFSSAAAITAFRMEQRVKLHGQVVEAFDFDVGFVMPGSTNTWSSTVLAADAADMIPADVLSGNVVIETTFFDDAAVIGTFAIRVWYE